MSRHQAIWLAAVTHVVYAASLLGLAIFGGMNSASVPGSRDWPIGFWLSLGAVTALIVIAPVGIVIATAGWLRSGRAGRLLGVDLLVPVLLVFGPYGVILGGPLEPIGFSILAGGLVCGALAAFVTPLDQKRP